MSGDSNLARMADAVIDRALINVWLVFPDEINDPMLLQRYADLLAPEELVQCGRFQFESDRKRYLLTRAAARTLLAQACGAEAKALRFKRSPHGKPWLENAPPLSFNISHTAGLIAIAIVVGAGWRLGIDVENGGDRTAPLHVADRNFSRDEAHALRALPFSAQHDAFYRYWTLKESYIKARGLGLSISMESFGFRWTSVSRVIEFRPSPEDTGSLWQFWQGSLDNRIFIALCAENGAPAEPRIVYKHYVPLRFETEYELIRSLGCTSKPTR